MGGREEGPGTAPHKKDLSMDGPGGQLFFFKEEQFLFPNEKASSGITRYPGPGEAGFDPEVQKNVYPKSDDIERHDSKLNKKRISRSFVRK